MIFNTTVKGIPCKCLVLEYLPYIPTRIYGPGREDADPPEDEYFDFEILDRKGYPAPWLAKYLKPVDEERLRDEFIKEYAAKAMNN